MRFHYPNLDRPKKAAKHVVRLMGDRFPLSKVQNGLATALGHRDWHELELRHASQAPTPLDQAISRDDFRARSATVSLRLARALGLRHGEAQYAIASSRLTGDTPSFEDQFAIRVTCWKTAGEWPAADTAGTTVRCLGSFAGPRRLAMLTADFSSGTESPVQIVTDNHFGICSRDEIEIPPDPLPPFLPYRLCLAYGAWTEPDGSRVLFSRDYAPLWHLRDGHPPQQVSPIEWIRQRNQVWFWEDATAPWEDPMRLAEEKARLASFGIDGLPLLVDLLPKMLASSGNVPTPEKMLNELRSASRLY